MLEVNLLLGWKREKTQEKNTSVRLNWAVTRLQSLKHLFFRQLGDSAFLFLVDDTELRLP